MKEKYEASTTDNKDLRRQVDKVTHQMKLVEDELFKLREDHTSKESHLEGANQDKQRIKGQVGTVHLWDSGIQWTPNCPHKRLGKE